MSSGPPHVPLAATQESGKPPGVISAAPAHYTTSNAHGATLGGDQSQAGTGLGHGNEESSPSGSASATNQADPGDAARSNRPGKSGFAMRMMKKMGWEEGEGLGADGSGITTHLRHQAEKRKRLPDSEGGGYAAPAIGRIVGGKRNKIEGKDDGPTWSIIVKLEGMLNGLDVDHEIQNGNLMQTIGERMGAYGVVERLYIDRSKSGQEPVFVKFTSELSAYRVSFRIPFQLLQIC